MAVTTWQPGTLYPNGALVSRQSTPPVVQSEPDNPGFEGGDTDWTKGTGWTIETDGAFAFVGLGYAHLAVGNNSDIVNDNVVPVTPGALITGRCVCYVPTAFSAGAVRIYWYDSLMALINYDQGNIIGTIGATFRESVVSAVAPPNAAFAAIGASADTTGSSGGVVVDQFSWDYTYAEPPPGLVFRAVQTNPGYSGNVEPTWPTVVSNTVVDNEVTWQAVLATRVVWEASPILVSGATEPNFPTGAGEVVADNTIVWTTLANQIQDERCPQSPVVAIAASKVFGADDDIIGFSATVNPLDWSSEDDAGYIPFGLQTYGSTPVTALGLYRGNLVAFNSQSFQMWQVDPDPANMALLDAVPIGTRYPKAVQPAGNDLLFLSDVGFRNVGIAGASTNLQADGIGEPIDPMVKVALRQELTIPEPIALYWPAEGQYWGIFGYRVFVLTINGVKSKTWSQYEFPEAITDWAIHDSDLYLRTENGNIWRMDQNLVYDDAQSPYSSFTVDEGADFIGYDPITDNIGDPVATTFTDHTVLRAAWNINTQQFEVYLSNVNEATESFAYLSVYVSSEAGEERVARVALSDLSIEALGTVVVDSVSYPNVFAYSWDMGNPFVYPGEIVRVVFEEFTGETVGQDIQGVVQWPHMDLGALGVEKALIGFDLTCDAPEGVAVSIGYDQRDLDVRTPDYTVAADTLPGKLIPIPVSGPSFDLKLTFAPGQHWEFQAANLYLQDRRPTS